MALEAKEKERSLSAKEKKKKKKKCEKMSPVNEKKDWPTGIFLGTVWGQGEEGASTKSLGRGTGWN